MFVAEYDGWAGAMISNTYTIGSYNPIKCCLCYNMSGKNKLQRSTKNHIKAKVSK